MGTTAAGRRYDRTVSAGLAVAAVTAAVVVRQVNPERHRLSPGCPFHELTGWWCPLCGATRGMHHLLHGDVAGALSRNALLAIIVPAAVTWWGYWAWRAWTSPGDRAENRRGANRHGRSLTHRQQLAAMVGGLVVVAFTVVRNTSVGRSLGP